MKKIDPKDKKKYIIRGIILLLVGIVGLVFAIRNLTNKDENPFTDSNNLTDAEKFKNEYESLNNQKSDNGTEYIKIEISKDNPMKYVTYDELMDILEDGSGIIYFGFPECPWCRNALPVLLDAAKEQNINEIYYFNAYDIRDEKVLNDNGEIVVNKEGTEEYNAIVDKLYDYLNVYEGLNDESIKRLYFPSVFFISNGKVVGSHVSTVDSQEDPNVPLNEEQYEELKSIYVDNIKKVFNFVCNDGC